MLSTVRKAFSYIRRLHKAGIKDAQIYYSDLAGLNTFLVPEDTFNTHLPLIEAVIVDAFDNDYNEEEDKTLLDILPTNEDEINLYCYKLAKDSIFKNIIIKNTQNKLVHEKFKQEGCFDTNRNSFSESNKVTHEYSKRTLLEKQYTTNSIRKESPYGRAA